MADLILKVGDELPRRCDVDPVNRRLRIGAVMLATVRTTTLDGPCSCAYEWCGKLYLTTANGTSSLDPNLDLVPLPPEPKLVPWESLDEVPLDAWFRLSVCTDAWRIVAFDPSEQNVRLADGWHSLAGLHRDYSFSLDNGKTWHPCGKLVHEQDAKEST